MCRYAQFTLSSRQLNYRGFPLIFLKYEMENNGWVYQWHLGDEPIKVTHKFNPPVTPEEFQLFEKYFQRALFKGHL